LLTHAADHIPYYREIFRERGFVPQEVSSLRDLATLSFLTRDIVRDRYRDLVDERTKSDHVHKHTRGSSGEPVFCEYDGGRGVGRQAVKWRGYGWSGSRPGMRALHYWGMPVRPAGLAGVKCHVDRRMRRETYIDCLRQDTWSLDRTVEFIKRSRAE